MSQIEVTKTTQMGVIGPNDGHASASKVTMYVLLTPGDGGDDDLSATRQAHVYAQKVIR